MTKKILFFIILFLSSILAYPVLCSQKPDFQKKCESAIGDNPGSIIVYDLEKKAFLAVVNPENAFKKAYRPGSIFKLVTAASLLENNRIKPSQTVNCKNYLNYKGREIICSKPGGHGDMNLVSAIGCSCSIYFYRFSHLLSGGEIKATAAKFGINRPLSIPGCNYKSSSGTCSPPENPSKFHEFAVGDEKGIKITPWHAANIAAIIATGRPLSLEISTPVLKKSTIEILRKGMEYAARKGTCMAPEKNLSFAAKTGTATDSRYPGKNLGWFISYTPAKKPKFIVVVFLEDGRGFTDAAPMGIKILEKL